MDQEPLAAAGGDRRRATQQRAGRRRAEHDDHRRTHCSELGVDPRMTRLDLGAVGLLVQPALAARLVLEVLDGVGGVDRRRGRCRLRRRTPRAPDLPARRTDRPARSSWSPGCSPTSINAADRRPSPNTVCVAGSQSGHPRQLRAACAKVGSEVVLGTNGEASTATVSTAIPEVSPPGAAVHARAGPPRAPSYAAPPVRRATAVPRSGSDRDRRPNSGERQSGAGESVRSTAWEPIVAAARC